MNKAYEGTLLSAVTANGAGPVLSGGQAGEHGSALVEVSGTFVGTITVEGSRDGATFWPVMAVNLATGSRSTTATEPGHYLLSILGLSFLRATVSAYASGSITAAATLIEQAAGGVGGEIGGSSAVITPTITVSTSPAYTAGDSIGGKITLTSALRVSGGTAVLQSIMISGRANQKPEGTILIFGADPTAATLTDNAAVVLSTNDFNVLASIPVSAADYVTINSKCYANLSGLGRTLKATTGTSLYAAFVVTSTPTFAATSDFQMRFGLLRD